MKVAVVGGGISGLTAAWLLNEYSDHEVELFEANHYVGGHTNTVRIKETAVDTGFIVFNKLTYPNFMRFLEILDVDYIPSNMSFSVTRTFGAAYEWSGNGLASLFSGIAAWPDRLSQLRLIWDLLRFNHLALDLLEGPEGHLTIQEYLAKHSYSEAFKRNYLLPIVSSIWSTPANKTALHFPMRTLIRFMHNHHLLQIFDQPQWLTIKNGSRRYVEKIVGKLGEGSCFKSTRIASIRMEASGKKLYLQTAADESPGLQYGPYDHVILASHADQTLSILKNSNCHARLARQIDILSRFQFNQNEAVLHNDLSLMPSRRATWTSWNYLITHDSQTISEEPTDGAPTSGVENTVCLTYWMNLLQSIPEETCGPVLVTLNPPKEMEPSSVFGRWKYEHPLYTSESVKAQEELWEIQTKEGLSYVGAWTKYGFHEDGLTSSLRLMLVEHPTLFRVRSPFKHVANCDQPSPVRPVSRLTRCLLHLGQFCVLLLSLACGSFRTYCKHRHPPPQKSKTS